MIARRSAIYKKCQNWNGNDATRCSNHDERHNDLGQKVDLFVWETDSIAEVQKSVRKQPS